MIRAIVAFLASVLTVVQAFSIYIQGQTLCFNNGCAIVDSLTTVSPLYFNIAGFLFFQTLFWCLLWGRDGSGYWHKFARLLLLAGLCAEAVLVFFQYSIVTVFCSYCMVVFAFIVLLNVLSGPRQIFRGIVLFSAVTAACFGLQFRAAGGSGLGLDAGSMAIAVGEKKEAQHYLFFSSTCAHCEKVIDALREENSCTVRFNPIERIEDFAFPGVEYFAEYNPEINLNFLKSLAIKEIPVLVSSQQQNIIVLRGEQGIREYLDENCRETKAIDYSGTSSVVPTEYMILPGVGNQGDDACPVAADCDPEVSGEAAGKQ
ncbi:MAG: hypothetical protein GQ542_15725 [Desulforhopalus sp.]|nr:hypothetical protein [Desulforhopalus sp.]